MKMSDGSAEIDIATGTDTDERSEISTEPDDYDGRPGFDENFLGHDFSIALPEVKTPAPPMSST